MPMPELENYLPQTNIYWDLEPVDIWEKATAYGQACYAAGKADALPPWPPEDGAKFKWGNRESIFKFKFGRWSCSRLPQHEYEPFFILDIHEQVALTVAWFKGELEKVNE